MGTSLSSAHQWSSGPAGLSVPPAQERIVPLLTFEFFRARQLFLLATRWCQQPTGCPGQARLNIAFLLGLVITKGLIGTLCFGSPFVGLGTWVFADFSAIISFL